MPNCPKCRTRKVQLAPQRGIAERLVGLVTIYPNRCQLCSHRFMAFRGRPGFIPRRDYQRVRVLYPVWFHSTLLSKSPSRGQEGTMVNLSIKGCRIEAEVRIPKGSHLKLEFEVSEDQAPITVEEALVRSQSGTGIGLKFLRIRDQERKRITLIIRQRFLPV